VQEKGEVSGKVGPVETHRGGGETKGHWTRLGTVVFWWAGGSGDLGSPQQLQGGERRGEAWLILERDGADPWLTGEGRSGGVSFKTGGEGHGVRCQRDLTSHRHGRGGREGAWAQAEGAEKRGTGHRWLQIDGHTGRGGRRKWGGGGPALFEAKRTNGGGVRLGQRVGW
jgi:hypothetical protein